MAYEYQSFALKMHLTTKKQETFYTNFMEYEVQLSLVLENQSYEEFSITDCIISLRMGRLLTFLCSEYWPQQGKVILVLSISSI